MTLPSHTPFGFGEVSGRIQPDRIGALEGEWSLCLGVDRSGVTSLFSWADGPLAFQQEIEKGVDNNYTLRAFVIGPTKIPVFSDPGPFVLADGGTLILNADRTDHTITWDDEDFVVIASATATEVTTVLNRDLDSEWLASEIYGGIIRLESTQIGRQSEISIIGGTTEAAFSWHRPAWLLFAEVDGVRTYERKVRPSDFYLVMDFLTALEDTSISAPFRIGLELGELENTPGTWATLMDLEIPSVYVDDLVFGAGPRVPALAVNRIPEPAEIARVDAPIELDIINDGSSLAGLEIFVTIGDGTEELAWTGGAAEPGWDGSLAGTTSISTNQTNFVLDPTIPLPGNTLISIRIDTVLGEGYTFLTEDVDGPFLIEVIAQSKSIIQVTWNEDVDDTALDLTNYSIIPVDLPAVTPAILAINRINPSTISLTTDERLSIGRTYRLDVVSVDDITGNDSGLQSQEFESFVPPRTPADRVFDLIKTLPEWNRIDQDLIGDLRRFVACLQCVTDLMLCEIDNFVEWYDPDVAPDDVLDMMLYDLSNPFSFAITTDQKRLLVRALVDIYKSKGTKQGIIDAIQFFLGITVEIDEINTGTQWFLGVSELAIDTDLGTSNLFLIYSFDIISPEILSQDQIDVIIEIVDIMKPAHTHLRDIIEPIDLGPIEPVELGLSELGVDWILH